MPQSPYSGFYFIVIGCWKDTNKVSDAHCKPKELRWTNRNGIKHELGNIQKHRCRFKTSKQNKHNLGCKCCEKLKFRVDVLISKLETGVPKEQEATKTGC